MSVPAPAKRLLDFIASIEAPEGYDTVYGNHQGKLAKPLTSWTVDEIIGAKPTFTARFGSSACGRYQFMRDTLVSLKRRVPLDGDEAFTPELQDALAYRLLLDRGYARFMAGRMSVQAFGLALAQEWASFPVLASVKGAHRTVARGETYYAGDRLNRALVAPEKVEAALNVMRRTATNTVASAPGAAPAVADATPVALTGAGTPPKPSLVGGFVNRLLGRADAAAPSTTPLPAEDTKGDPAVYRVQKALADRGYAEVGELDGVIGGPGSKTRAAIRAAQEANGLPITGEMDAPFLAALPAMPVRVMARSTATVADLRAAGSTPVAAADSVGFVGRVLGLGGVVGGIAQSGVLDSVKSAADTASDTLGTVKSVVTTGVDAVQWTVAHWWIFAAGGGLWFALRGVEYALRLRALYRQGTITRAGA